jgi:hypothetical protein
MIVSCGDALIDFVPVAAAERTGRPVRPRVKSLPAELSYEHDLVVAEEEFVFLHSRISGMGQPRALVTVDIVRLAARISAKVIFCGLARVASADIIPPI